MLTFKELKTKKMKKTNAILFSKMDLEDRRICGGIAFKVENANTCKEAFKEIQHKLEDAEVIKYLIEDRCLIDDLFNGDETYQLVRTSFGTTLNTNLYLYFENKDGNEVQYIMSADLIWMV